ncbi:HAD-like domain-containing protein [Umbelopsis sp. AD052]|nr:HAD-like domain-containing protein [Umbelopsis sp. AD052]
MAKGLDIQVYSDFDGTISLQDTGCLLIDDPRCLGFKRRRELDHLIMNKDVSFRDGLEEMWAAVTLTWEEAWKDHLEAVKVDPGFSAFYDYCKSVGVPVKIVSSGIYPVIEQIMENFIGDRAKEIEIISNGGGVDGRKWSIQWRDDTSFGHDKSLTLKKARESATPETIFVFCGDGVSDISAAQNADILFARHGRDLETWCQRENVPFLGFDNFSEVEKVVAKLVEGKVTLQRDEKTGFCSLIDV